jgi:hypothetical protein
MDGMSDVDGYDDGSNTALDGYPEWRAGAPGSGGGLLAWKGGKTLQAPNKADPAEADPAPRSDVDEAAGGSP